MARPKEFEKEDVLDRAIQVFICKGFEATSIQDLVDAMGVGRSSIYDTFGDKEALFLEALDRYDELWYADLKARLTAEGSRIESIRKNFARIVDEGTKSNDPGCLMVNSTVERALSDVRCRQRSDRNFQRAVEAYHMALLEAEAAGEMAKGQDLLALARFLVTMAKGLRVVAKATKDRATLEAVAATAMAKLT